MSNLSGKNIKNDTLTPLTEKSGVTASNKTNQRWSFIQSDLSSALENWKDLEKAQYSSIPQRNTEKNSPEKQLNEIKSIITQLKEKLEQF